MVSENKVKNAEWDTEVLLCPWPTYIVTCAYTTHIHTYKVSLLYKERSNKVWRGKGPRGEKRKGDYSWYPVRLEKRKTTAKIKTHDD